MNQFAMYRTQYIELILIICRIFDKTRENVSTIYTFKLFLFKSSVIEDHLMLQ